MKTQVTNTAKKTAKTSKKANKATQVVNIDWGKLLDINRNYHTQSLSQVCAFLNQYPSLKGIIGGRKFTPIILFNLSKEAFTLKDGTARVKFTPFPFLKALRVFDGDAKELENKKTFEGVKEAHDKAAAAKEAEKKAKRAKKQEANQDKPKAKKTKAKGAAMLEIQSALKAS